MNSNFIENTVSSLINKVPVADNTYIGEDGLKRCSVCGRKVQTEVELWGKKQIVPCICDCRVKELEEERKALQRVELNQKRKHCFAETNMASWTFENDDRQNAKLSDAMMNYVKNFTDLKKQGKGLLLSGTVGTGKTYYAACIANALIDKGYRVKMTNFASLTNIIQGKFEGKQEFINSLNGYQLLIIDDLGAERKSEFMQEMVFNIIDSRYRAGLPFIITTNLTLDEIKKPQSIEYSRIYDRILERCFPVQVNGASRRRQNVKDSYFDMKDKLGL